MLKRPFISFLFILSICSIGYQSMAQSIRPADLRSLKLREDSLQEYARYMITDTFQTDRMISDSMFTRLLVRALQIKHSFLFPFDSVHGISHLYAPDSSFRIFTWNLQFDDYYSRQKGAIQLRTADGSLRLLPLRDVSEFTANIEDSVRSRNNWVGAVYYNIVQKEHAGKQYYTLFGIDFHSVQSNKKWIEVMYFNDRKEPVFGGPFFSFEDDSIKQETKYRYSMEFKKDARVLANYIPDLGLILIDHLISETDQPELKFTMVPDGDNEAFRWEKGRWIHMNKAFDYKLDMEGADPYLGRPPVEKPVL